MIFISTFELWIDGVWLQKEKKWALEEKRAPNATTHFTSKNLLDEFEFLKDFSRIKEQSVSE